MWGIGAHKPYTMIGRKTREQALREVNAKVYYDWSLTPDIYEGITSIPMYWDESQIGKPVGGNSEWVMGFNEGDSAGQANIPVREEARLWRRIEQDNPNRKLVSPVPTADNPGRRFEFLEAYEDMWHEKPRIDAVSMHIYPRTEEYFHAMVEEAKRFAKIFGAKIWVTEYATLPCWAGGMPFAIHMLEYMTNYFVENPQVFGFWAPFILGSRGTEGWAFKGACNPTLFYMNTGEKTRLGEAYAGLYTEQKYADPRADVNNDGTVDILDLSLVGANFGLDVEGGANG